jgi:hypothetical protein
VVPSPEDCTLKLFVMVDDFGDTSALFWSVLRPVDREVHPAGKM